jgi:hypothetical protein
MANPNAAALNQAGRIQFHTDALTGATFKIRLFTGTALSATSVIGDLSSNELSGSGYPAGGITLTIGTIVWDGTDGRVEVPFSQATLTPSGAALTWRQAAITIDNGTNYIYSVLTWPADETAADGIDYYFDIKLTSGPQGTTVDLVDN